MVIRPYPPRVVASTARARNPVRVLARTPTRLNRTDDGLVTNLDNCNDQVSGGHQGNPVRPPYLRAVRHRRRGRRGDQGQREAGDERAALSFGAGQLDLTAVQL